MQFLLIRYIFSRLIALLKLPLLLSLIAFSSFANVYPAYFEKNLKLEHISTSKGLSQSYAFDILQDNSGFIWIATQDGLNKYDGSKFTYYRNNASDPNSLADNSVRTMLKDSKGNIWVGTENGLGLYNEKLDNFTNYKHIKGDENSLSDNIIWNIYEDSNKSIWVSTDTTLHKFNSEERTFTKIKVRKLSDNSLLDLRAIKTVFQDKNGFYWLGTFDTGFYILTQDLSPNTTLKNSIENQIGQTNLRINQIEYIKDKNEYWLGTNKGLFVLDSNYQLKSEYQFNNETTNSSSVVRTFYKLSDSHYWIGTNKGLYAINPLEQNTKNYHFSNVTQHVDNNDIYKLYIDKSNTLWIGTTNGVFKLSLFPNIIKHSTELNQNIQSNTYAIIQENNLIWFTNDSSLYSFDVKSNTANHILNTKHSIFQLISSPTEIFLLTEKNKLLSYNFDTEKLKEIKFWREKVSHNQLTRIIYYNGYIFYLNYQGELFKVDLKNEEVMPLLDKPLYFSSIHLDNHGLLWLSESEGLLYNYDTQKNKLVPFQLQKNSNYLVGNTSSIQTTDTHVILGSNTQGILLIDIIQKRLTIFNEDNLLSNNFIADIVVDKNNKFWISTNKGINYLDPTNNKIKSFLNDNNLKNHEYISQSSALDNDGNIYFGSTNGFHYFTPEQLIKIKQELNAPVFTQLLITNKKVKISQAKMNSPKILAAHLNSLESLTLNHYDSPFSIDFVSPNAKLSNQIKYRYKLIGVDKNWLETDQHNLRATYTNLSAGNYQFEVQAYDIYDPTITKSKSIKVTILPPWWLSNSAMLIYTLIALLILAYLLQQFRHKRLYHLQIKASEERLKLSLWGSGDEMWDWNIKQNKIYRSNIWGILEFPQDGKRNLGNDGDNETNVNKDDINRITQALEDHFDEKTEHFEATYRVKDKNNKWIWILDRGKIVERDDRNNPVRMTGTLKDISQIKKADERLKLFAKCIENISDAVVIYDRKFNIVDVNKSFQRITGKSKSKMLGQAMNFSRYPDSFTLDVKKHLITKGSWHGEIESRRDNGQIYLTDLNIDVIRDDNKSISHFVGVFSDITKRKETEAELRKLANTDTLTGLPNRSYFQAHQARLVHKKIPHALLVFDLDNFKKVNDSMGHEVGDILLCKVAERLRLVGRKHDTIYRLGGDEFSLIIEDTNDIHTITTIAKSILSTIAEPLKLKSQEVVLYSSIGIVLYPEDGISPHDLLKNADTAMYHAKHTGGNQYQFFNSSMNKQAVKRLQIEGLIRHGLKEDYFSVFYQPKIEISTGKVAGMEALVRFETPSKGIISPVVFIPVSEETGQIIDIGEVVLRKACYATKEWIDAGLFDGRIAVNLSAVQFTQPNLVGMIQDILKETQLPAKFLELEITEGTVMDSPQKAIDTMLQIRALGIHLSLDDFGTGYSSLAYLKKFPLNTLKIDKAFVDDIETSEQGRNMVATIVTIAHNLGLQVVAEGVETNQQLSFLSGLRCEQLQGYLYSKPLPQKDFRSYLLSHQITDKSTSFNRL